MHKDMIFNELHKSYALSMHKDTIFIPIYMHHKCIKVQSFNRLDEFIHIMCIENKETILIGVTSGSDTTVRVLMAINHTYTAEKLNFLRFLTRLRIHVIRLDDSGIEEYLIRARRSLFRSLVCASNPLCRIESRSEIAPPSTTIHTNEPSWKPREKRVC